MAEAKREKQLVNRQLKQTANKPVTRLVLLTGFNTPPTPSQEGSQVQPVAINKHSYLIKDETKRKIGISDFSTKPTNFYNLDVIISVGMVNTGADS